MDNLFWLWLIAGVALLIIEIAIPSFFSMFFGISALIVGVLTYFCPSASLVTQGLVFTALSLVIITVFFKCIKPRMKPILEGNVMDEVGVLVKKHSDHQGDLRFFTPIQGEDLWQVESDEVLEYESYYKVVAFDKETKILKVVKHH